MTYLNKGDIAHSIDFEEMARASASFGVVGGCAPSGLSNTMNVMVGSGIVSVYGFEYQVNQTTVSLASGQTNQRIDYIVYNPSSGAATGNIKNGVYPVYGEPSNPPSPRSLGVLDVPLARVNVAANTTSVSQTDVIDRRIRATEYSDFARTAALMGQMGYGVDVGLESASGTGLTINISSGVYVTRAANGVSSYAFFNSSGGVIVTDYSLENFNVGAINGQQGWTGDTSFVSDTTTSRFGTQSVSTTNVGDSSISKTITQVKTRTYTFALRVATATTAQTLFRLFEDSTEISRIQLQSDGTIEYNSNVDFSPILTYNTDQWYKFDVSVNSNNTQTISVDDVVRASNVALINNMTNGINKVTLFVAGTGSHKKFFDTPVGTGTLGVIIDSAVVAPRIDRLSLDSAGNAILLKGMPGDMIIPPAVFTYPSKRRNKIDFPGTPSVVAGDMQIPIFEVLVRPGVTQMLEEDIHDVRYFVPSGAIYRARPNRE